MNFQAFAWRHGASEPGSERTSNHTGEDLHGVAARNRLTTFLFASHYGWLKRVVYAKARDADAAEEVAADAFLQLLTVPRLSDIQRPRALLRTIASRILYKAWRRRDVERACLASLRTLQTCDVEPSAEEHALLCEALQTIDAVLASLDTAEREIFLLYRLEQQTYAQIAESHGLSVSATRRVVAKGLRACLTGLTEQ